MTNYLFLAAALLGATLHAATTYYVSPAGNDASAGTSWATARKTIQSAIDSAQSDMGDMVIVTNGAYAPITADKTIAIRSVEGAGKTIIDGEKSKRCATFYCSVPYPPYKITQKRTTLVGFTLKNGAVPKDNFLGNVSHGGVVTGGTLKNCILSETGKAAGFSSDAEYAVYDSTLENCEVTNNEQIKGTFINCLISNNDSIDTCTFKMCIIRENSFLFQYSQDGSNSFENCTLVGNAGQIGLSTFKNCILFANNFTEYFLGEQNSNEYEYCFGAFSSDTPEKGNVVGADYPGFVDPLGGDFRLSSDSPCLSKGDPGLVEPAVDMNGHSLFTNGRINMGAMGGSGIASSAPRALFVNAQSGDDSSGNGSSAKPYKSIQKAVASAPPFSTITVNNGRYSPIGTLGLPLTIQSVNGAAQTVISGGNTSRCAELRNPNSFLKGFTLENGYSETRGGAVLGGSLSACTISNSKAEWDGGGAYGCILTDCTISNNKAETEGGGAYGCILTNCTITNNKAWYGSGVSNCTLENSNVSKNSGIGYRAKLNNGDGEDEWSYGGGAAYCTLTDCEISENKASRGGGAIGSTLTNCIVKKNAANVSGGGLLESDADNCLIEQNKSYWGGGFHGAWGELVEAVSINSVIKGNEATEGAGSCSGIFINCTITENKASDSGGGGIASSIFLNCVINKNSAANDGGGVAGYGDAILVNSAVFDNSAGWFGGGVFDSYLENCTVSANTAGAAAGGAFACYGINSIIWGNTCKSSKSGHNFNTYYWEMDWDQNGKPIHSEDRNSVYAPDSFFSYSCAPGLSGTNIASDPKFANAAKKDFTLQVNSPCVNSGDPEYRVLYNFINYDYYTDFFDVLYPGIAADAAGNPRICGRRIDIGAYEYVGAVRSVEVRSNLPGGVSPAGTVRVFSDEGQVFTARESLDDRSFIGFLVNGAWISRATSFTWFPEKAGDVLTAVYETYADLDAQGGVVDVACVGVIYGECYPELPIPVRAGYEFIGWSLNPAGARRGWDPTFFRFISSTEEPPAVAKLDDHTLYAQWRDVNTTNPAINHWNHSTAFAGGVYNGFVYDEESVMRGTAAFTATLKTLKVTASLVTQTRKISFSGKIVDAGEGVYTAQMSEKTGWRVSVAFARNTCFGEAVSPTGEVFVIDGARNRFTDKTDLEIAETIAPLVGSYTAIQEIEMADVVSPNPEPKGTGYLTLTVAKTGAARVAGVLPNGKTYSFSTTLEPYRQDDGTLACAFPIFSVLSSKQGSLSGLLWITENEEGGKRIAVDTENGRSLIWESKSTAGDDTYWTTLDGAFWNPKPILAPELLFTAEPGLIPWYETKTVDPSGDLRWDTVEGGLELLLNPKGTAYTVPKALALTKDEDKNYIFDTANSGKLTFAFTARTGIFKGTFNGYIQVSGAKAPVLRTSAATYAGVFLQNPDGTLAGGKGHALVAETEPNAKKLKIKRSFPVEIR